MKNRKQKHLLESKSFTGKQISPYLRRPLSMHWSFQWQIPLQTPELSLNTAPYYGQVVGGGPRWSWSGSLGPISALRSLIYRNTGYGQIFLSDPRKEFLQVRTGWKIELSASYWGIREISAGRAGASSLLTYTPYFCIQTCYIISKINLWAT